MKTINIYTDGACSGNQNDTNLGGWGALLEYGDHSKELFGGEENTTNNRMEMMALLNALKALKKTGQTISVFSDSSYLVNCFREKWYENWQRNGWRTSKKTDVENRDLWEALFQLINQHQISFYRVKGHVNLQSPKTDKQSLYDKFIQWNGPHFTMDDFISITEKNNRADHLANKGIDTLREQSL
ncbi:MAG: ribonuclease HI [Clostridiales bacterium]|nr:ribonuclease HI [Clostridiales bacterium]